MLSSQGEKLDFARDFRGKTGVGSDFLLQIRAKFNSVCNISFFLVMKCHSFLFNFWINSQINSAYNPDDIGFTGYIK